MASLLRSTLSSSPLFLPPKPNPERARVFFIRCGPRSKRGPLVKGRTLSSEAILAVQSLKRAYAKSNSSPPPKSALPDLTRLLKRDLLATLRELLRQDLCPHALHVLSTLRSEFPGGSDDLTELYADVILALSKNNCREEIDRLVLDLELGAAQWWGKGDQRGLVRVVRGLVEAGRRESTVRIVGMMRRSGCGDTWTADEYLVSTLSRGLKGMGEAELAAEVERDFGLVYSGSFGNSE